jgi:hypothetical protein
VPYSDVEFFLEAREWIYATVREYKDLRDSPSPCGLSRVYGYKLAVDDPMALARNISSVLPLSRTLTKVFGALRLHFQKKNNELNGQISS